MKGKDDLLSLLNDIKRDMMAQAGAGGSFYPFTMKHINYYCNPGNTWHRYKSFQISKKSGGTRQITAPRNESFKLILRCLNELLKAVYSPSAYAMGFTEGRSVVTNAEAHKGMNYVFNIDLKDFFPSIEQARVWKRLQIAPFNFPVPVASVIAGLCSMQDARTMDDGTTAVRYVLPQGAPTSPIITNMVCDKLDRRLAGLAKRFGVRYTRYADDITFSSMHNVYQVGGEFRQELQRIIAGQGFTMNEAKTRLQKRGARQEVTGIVVNDKLNVTQAYVRSIRNILYIWDRYGYNVAYAKFLPVYKADKGHVRRGNPDLVNVIDGKLMYLKMVKGDADSTYLRLRAKFDKLSGDVHDPSKTTDHAITYVVTTPLPEFERRNATTVVIATPEPCDGGAAAHRYAYFEIGGKKVYASVNKAVKPEDEGRKDLLSISSCRDKDDKPFWLVHLSSKTVTPALVDVDALNTELDSLLD